MPRNPLHTGIEYKQTCHRCRRILDYIPNYPVETIYDMFRAPFPEWWDFTLSFDGKIWCPGCYYWLGPGHANHMQQLEDKLSRDLLHVEKTYKTMMPKREPVDYAITAIDNVLKKSLFVIVLIVIGCLLILLGNCLRCIHQ